MAYAYVPSRVIADEVHKVRQENVWISDAMAITDHTMAASFAVPAWKPEGVRFAELMEVQRQMAMLQLHRQAGVPLDAVFIVDLFSLRHITESRIPNEGTIHSQLVSSGGVRGRFFVQRLAFEAPGGLVALGKSHARALPRKLYKRVRTRPNKDAARATPEGSLAVGERVLTVDRNDPLLSDHDSDHITALQIIAAVEEAVTAGGCKALSALSLGFEQYTEFEPAPKLLVEERRNNRFRGIVRQDGASTAVFSGRTASSPSPADGTGTAVERA